MISAPAKLESALARLEACPDPDARAAAREAVAAILELYGEGLRRLSERVRAASPEGDRILAAAAEDEVTASLLLLHGLHPLPLEARVRRAVDGVCAAAPGEGGRVDVLSASGDLVRLRVAGSERLRRAVAGAVEAVAPEVERVEVLRADPGLISAEALVRRETVHERCELCGEGLSSMHEHLFDLERRQLRCACAACSVLLDAPANNLRGVRKQAVSLDGFRISDARWQALEVPVGLAFFSLSSRHQAVIAGYPGPGGVVEAVVPAAAWDDLVTDNPVLAELEPDTSALLADRLSERESYHLLSIDECYRLAALVRTRWQGLSGGDGPRRAVSELLAGLAEAAS